MRHGRPSALGSKWTPDQIVMDLRTPGGVFGEQGARWKLELGCCSFASKTRRIQCWKCCLAGSAGHGAGAAPRGAWRTSLLSLRHCSLCSAPLHAQQVTLHLALLYKFTFVAVGEIQKKGFLSARLALQTVSLPVLLFW